jgi:hypothetical protein
MELVVLIFMMDPEDIQDDRTLRAFPRVISM